MRGSDMQRLIIRWFLNQDTLFSLHKEKLLDCITQ